MVNYLTIDGGTTNTRISLCTDYKVVETLKYNVGAKKGIDNGQLLKETIKDGIAKILAKNGLEEGDISVVLVCGMLTCEFGLIELKHITAPAGREELNANIYKCEMKEISNIPFAFVRGVKNECTALENGDMMRGEETELVGVFEGEGVYVFPGSHTKIISTDEKGRIADFRTMLTGEMIYAVTNDTILKDAVKLKDFEIIKEYLLKGYSYADMHGISEALFKVRILKNMFKATDEEIYSFFMGIMVHNEVKHILSEAPKRVIIGGKAAIKEAISILLGEFTDVQIKILSEEAVENSTINGLIRIYENTNEKRLK